MDVKTTSCAYWVIYIYFFLIWNFHNFIFLLTVKFQLQVWKYSFVSLKNSSTRKPLIIRNKFSRKILRQYVQFAKVSVIFLGNLNGKAQVTSFIFPSTYSVRILTQNEFSATGFVTSRRLLLNLVLISYIHTF